MSNPRRRSHGPHPSRRSILTASTTSLLTIGSGLWYRDTCVVACEGWLATNAEAERLQGRWAKIEDHLVSQHRWYRLTERQRCALPAAQELFDIDERLEILHEERDALLHRLPSLQATSRSGLAAKLAVAAVALSPEDHEDAHNLIASILRDLKMIPVGTV
ncbi:MAG: hypothetical protein JNM47_10720 [Hyphomonadaceae bacterium]|nr:hypothetical protein [Hyphomonadaceae bacterium]